MAAGFGTARRLKSGVLAIATYGIVVLTVSSMWIGQASATLGPSLFQFPGIVGDWNGDGHKNWLRIEGHLWQQPAAAGGGPARGGGGGFGGGVFTGPPGPKNGPAQLVVAVDKHSPGLAKLMALCKSRAVIGDVSFAESSDAAAMGPPANKGPIPADVPAYYEYQLKNTSIDSCPVAADAPEQVIILKFDDISLKNFQMPAGGYSLPPTVLPPLEMGGKTKAFAIYWYALAGDMTEKTEDQCPTVNSKADAKEYYKYMPAAEAAREEAALAPKGGVSYETGQMGLRGPGKIDVTMLPGIVGDPGLIEPTTKIARGFDLDNDDGSGKPPPGVCAHVNYTSPDGRKGIDSQFYRTAGCINGLMGHKGTFNQILNTDRRWAARTSLMVEIRGIDNDQNDDHVQVRMITSRDALPKNAAGTKIVANYSFRPATDAANKFYEVRLNGKIVNGVIITDPVPMLRVPASYEDQFHNARLRLEIMPDGSLKGIVGGYFDWRRAARLVEGSNQEQIHGVQTPGFYNALKRNADGMKDPVTGQCMGISTMFDIEGSAAFLVPGEDEPGSRPVTQTSLTGGK